MSAELRTVLAVDPGSSKSGVAAVRCAKRDCGDEDRTAISCCILFHEVVPSAEVPSKLAQLAGEYEAEVIVLGNGTGSADIAQRLAERRVVRVEIVDERFTTLDARKLFFKMNPPRGLALSLIHI